MDKGRHDDKDVLVGYFGERWTPRELAKIREIKARPPELRAIDKARKHPRLSEVDGMSDFQVDRFLKWLFNPARYPDPRGTK